MPGPVLHFVDVLEPERCLVINHSRLLGIAKHSHVRPRVVLSTHDRQVGGRKGDEVVGSGVHGDLRSSAPWSEALLSIWMSFWCLCQRLLARAFFAWVIHEC